MDNRLTEKVYAPLPGWIPNCFSLRTEADYLSLAKWANEFADATCALRAGQVQQLAGDSYKGMFMAAIGALAEIDAILGLPEDGCNDPQVTVSALKDFVAGAKETAAYRDNWVDAQYAAAGSAPSQQPPSGNCALNTSESIASEGAQPETARLSEHAKAIKRISKWLDGCVELAQSSFDSPPEPASKFDFELMEASHTLSVIAASLSEAVRSQQAEPNKQEGCSSPIPEPAANAAVPGDSRAVPPTMIRPCADCGHIRGHSVDCLKGGDSFIAKQAAAFVEHGRAEDVQSADSLYQIAQDAITALKTLDFSDMTSEREAMLCGIVRNLHRRLAAAAPGWQFQ